MQHDSLSEKRLYALIGDKVCDLPPSFLERLDSILQQQRLEQTLQSPTTLTLISPASREEGERALHDAECQRWRRASIVCRRNLESLSAILEILESAHADVVEDDDAEERMLAPRLVDGLIIVGRRLADTTNRVLDGGGE